MAVSRDDKPAYGLRSPLVRRSEGTESPMFIQHRIICMDVETTPTGFIDKAL